jgi:hypothetical protein
MSSITSGISHLTRSQVWSEELKQILQDELTGQGHVRWISDFNGDLLNIPSIGEGTVRNYTEDTAAKYDSLDTGNFQFSITEYLQSGTYITQKARQDLAYAAQLEASFIPTQARALAERVESDIYGLAAGGASGGQTAGDTNAINGASHRWTASGDAISGERPMSVVDFAKALYSLKKANVPGQSLIAIVDPSVEYTMNTLSSLTSVSNNPMWGGIIASGIGSGARFSRNIYGFDVYVSNYLAAASSGGQESISSVAVSDSAAGVCNVFMSAADPMLLPFIGAWRQPPKVDSEYNKDFQREEYLTTARYGLKVYRPENLVVVLSSTLVVV